MLKISFSRMKQIKRGGKRRGENSFSIVVRDSKTKRDTGKSSYIGYREKNKLFYNKSLFEYWISKGAQPTESVIKAIKKLENNE